MGDLNAQQALEAHRQQNAASPGFSLSIVGNV